MNYRLTYILFFLKGNQGMWSCFRQWFSRKTSLINTKYWWCRVRQLRLPHTKSLTPQPETSWFCKYLVKLWGENWDACLYIDGFYVSAKICWDNTISWHTATKEHYFCRLRIRNYRCREGNKNNLKDNLEKCF